MDEQTSGVKKVKQANKNKLFSKIETEEDALNVIKDSSNGFYFLAALQATLGFVVSGPMILIDSILFVILGFSLRKYESRAVAIILLLLSLAALYSTMMNRIYNTGGQNIFLAAVMVWASIRAFQATVALKKIRKAQKDNPAATI